MILLVDDEPQLQTLFARRLRQEGYQVREVADGAEAFELLSTAAFNLIITDLRMPKVDGVKLARLVRAKWPTLPIILLSGHLPEEAGDVIWRVNVHFLQKPLAEHPYRDGSTFDLKVLSISFTRFEWVNQKVPVSLFYGSYTFEVGSDFAN